MSASCQHPHPPFAIQPALRRTLWFALIVNAAMFGVEILSGLQAQSLALWADAIDFLADAAAYAITLVVLGSSLRTRLRAARAKALAMALLALVVLAQALWRLQHPSMPNAPTMGAVAVLALVANLAVAWVLYRYREGDANLRSVWLCSRNDAVGNLLVGVAALGVLCTGTAWPDLAIASVMAALGLSAARSVWQQASAQTHQSYPIGSTHQH